jgi:hypothetical protein
MAENKTNVEEGSTPIDVNRMKQWYKEQISMAKLRTELSELMAREAKATAERLHFLGSIAAMQGNNPEQENQDPENNPEEENAGDDAPVRDING